MEAAMRTRKGACGMEKPMRAIAAVFAATMFALVMAIAMPAAAWATESGVENCPYDFDSNNDGEVDSWFFSEDLTDADNQVYAYLADNGETLVVAGKGATVKDIDSVKPDADKKVAVNRSTAMGSLRTIRLEQGVTYLGANLTRNTKSISVELPASLKGMNIELDAKGEYSSTFGNAFYDSASKTPYGIAKISVAEGNTSFKMEDGVLFDSDGTVLLCYTDEASSDYTVPSSVKTIAAKAFARTNHLQSVKMNEGLETIARNAFDIAPNITEITVPSTVRNIAYGSLTSGEKLSHVTFLMTDYDFWDAPFGNGGPSTISFAEGLTSIPDKFCEGAARVETVELPSTIEKIGWRAFQNCTNLKKLTKDGVELEKLKEFVVTEGSTYSKAFSGCTNLTSFPISKNAPLKEIPPYTFEQTGIISLSAPNALESIGDRAFQNCKSLDTVKFNEGLKNIGTYAFYQCSALQKIVMPKSIEAISEYAFAESGLNNISIVTDGDLSLLNDHALSETTPAFIEIGSVGGNVDLGSIGGNASVLRLCGASINFNHALLMTNPTGVSVWHTLDLTGVKIVTSSVAKPATGDDNRSWIWYLGAKEGASWRNKGIIYVSDSSTQASVEDSLKAGVAVRQHIDAVTNGGTFSDETSFEAGVLATPEKAGYDFGGWYEDPNFSGNEVTEVETADSGEAYRAYYAKWVEKGLVASGDCSAAGDGSVTWKLVQTNDDATNPTYTLKISGTGAMADYATGGSVPWKDYKVGISSVVVSDGVTSLGDRSFMGCSNLTSVDIADSVTSYGTNCVHGCTGLVALNIGKNVTNIKQLGISTCSSLVDLMVDADNSKYAVINGWLYEFADDGTACLLQVPGGVAASLTSIDVPDQVSFGGVDYKVVSVGKMNDVDGGYAFSGAKNATGVTLGANVTTVGANAFNGCAKLPSIDMKNVSEIGYAAFTGCSGLENVQLGDSLVTISNNAFQYCAGLISVRIPDSVETIGKAAFGSNTALSVVRLGSGVTSLGVSAFDKDAELIALDMTKVGASDFLPSNNVMINRSKAKLAIVYTASSDVLDIWKNAKLGTLATTALADAEGGTFAEGATFEEGVLATPTKDGYIFGGWYDNASFSGDTVTSAKGDCSYYAKWNSEIIFNANGGDGTMNAQVVADGEAVDLTENEFTREGYKFAGWNTAADGTGDSYADKQQVTPSGSMTLYAQWTPVYVVSIEGSKFTYTGKAIEPAVTVKYGSDTLTASDYDVAYFNNVNVNDNGYAVVVPHADNSKSIISPSFKIVKDEKPTVEITLPENLTYDGSNKTAAAVAKTSAGNEITDAEVSIAYYLNQECTGQSADIAPNAAGEFWVKATLNGTDNYAGATAVKEMSIAKATPTVSLDERTVEYTGNPIEVNDATVTFGNDTLSSKDDGNVNKPTIAYEYYLDDKCQDELAGAPTGLGDYYVKATATFGEGSDFTTASTVAKLIIERVSVEKPAAKAEQSLTYNGQDQTYIIEPANEDDSKWYDVTGNVNKDAGDDYVAKATLKYGVQWADGSFDDVEFKYSINKADIDISGVEFKDDTATYDGTDKSIKISGTLPEGVSVSYEGNGKVEVNKDGYDVTASFALTDELAKNYNVPASKKAKLFINPVLVAKPVQGKTTISYNGTEQTFDIALGDANKPEDANWYAIFNNKGTEVGSYTASVSLKHGAEWSDGTIDDQSFTFEITQGATKVDFSAMSEPYTSKPVEAHGAVVSMVDSSAVVGAMVPTYEYFADENCSADKKLDSAPTNAGTYYVKATYAGDKNRARSSAIAKLEITKATTATVTLGDIDATYAGKPVEASGAKVVFGGNEVENVSVTYEYFADENCSADKKLSGAPIDAGIYYVKAVFAGNDNLEPATSDAAKLTIGVADIEGFEAKDYVGVYDGKAHGIEVKVPAGATIEYGTTEGKYGSDAPTFTDVSETTVYYRVTMSNHADLTGFKVVRITKADLDMSGVEFKGASVAYNGEVQKLAVSGDLPEGVTVGYANNDNKNVGTYEVQAIFALSDELAKNYNVPAFKTATLAITPAVIDAPAVNTTEFVYNGQPQKYFDKLDIPSVAGKYAYSVADNVRTNAGTQTVTLSLVDKANTVWKSTSKSDDLEYEFDIAKQQIDVSGVQFANASATYDGTAKSIQATDVPDGVEVDYAYEKDGKAVDAADVKDAGIYKATAMFAVADTDNTKLAGNASKTATLTINKKQIDAPEADATVFDYNGKAQTYTIAASEWYSVEGNEQTEAGTYDVTASLNDVNNTEWNDSTTDAKVYAFTIRAASDTTPASGEAAQQGTLNNPVETTFGETVSFTVNIAKRANSGVTTFALTQEETETVPAGKVGFYYNGTRLGNFVDYDAKAGTATLAYDTNSKVIPAGSLQQLKVKFGGTDELAPSETDFFVKIDKANQTLAFAKAKVSQHVGTLTNALSGAIGAVTFASGDAKVATVATDGIVTIVAPGTATITATAAGDEWYNEATATYDLTATEHAFSKYVYDKTDPEKGHWQICTVDPKCNATTAIVEHNFGEWEVTTAATTTADGERMRSCDDCGYEETQSIPAAKAPVFESPSLSVHVSSEPMAGPELKNVAKGDTVTYAISDEKVATIDAAGKVAPVTAGKATVTATVTSADGSHEPLAATYEVTVTTHQFGEGEVTTEATCTTDGVKTFTCQFEGCGETKTEAIPALGHAWADDFTVDTSATCTDDGSQSKHCTRCGEIDPDSVEVIQATGHQLAYQFNANGHWQQCTKCDFATEPEAHQFGEWTVTKEATATEAGEKVHTCAVCGYSVAEEIAATGDNKGDQGDTGNKGDTGDQGNKGDQGDNSGTTGTDTGKFDNGNGAAGDKPNAGSNQGNAAGNGSNAANNGNAMAATADGMVGVAGAAAAMGAIALAGAAFAARRRHNG